MQTHGVDETTNRNKGGREDVVTLWQFIVAWFPKCCRHHLHHRRPALQHSPASRASCSEGRWLFHSSLLASLEINWQPQSKYFTVVHYVFPSNIKVYGTVLDYSLFAFIGDREIQYVCSANLFRKRFNSYLYTSASILYLQNSLLSSYFFFLKRWPFKSFMKSYHIK